MFYDSSPYQSLTNRANSTKQSIDAGYYVEDICILFCVIYSMWYIRVKILYIIDSHDIECFKPFNPPTKV